MPGIIEVQMTTERTPAHNPRCMWVRRTDDVWHRGRRGWLMTGAPCVGMVLVAWDASGNEWSWVPLDQITLG